MNIRLQYPKRLKVSLSLGIVTRIREGARATCWQMSHSDVNR